MIVASCAGQPPRRRRTRRSNPALRRVDSTVSGVEEQDFSERRLVLLSSASCSENRVYDVQPEEFPPELADVASEASRERVSANGVAPSGAEPSAVTSAFRRAPDGAVRGQAPPRCGNSSELRSGRYEGRARPRHFHATG